MDAFNYLHLGIGIVIKNEEVAANSQWQRTALINEAVQIQSGPLL